jgi:hypothetical protein
MGTKVIPLSELQADPEGLLSRCVETGDPVVIEMPNHRRVRIAPVEEDEVSLIDDLIENNEGFRDLLTRSSAGPFQAFPFTEPGSLPEASREP